MDNLLDAHCHPLSAPNPVRFLTLARSRNERVWAAAMDEEQSEALVKLSQKRPFMVPGSGVHPWITGFRDPDLKKLKSSLKRSGFLSEAGLDRRWAPGGSDFSRQVKNLKSQLTLASDLGKPAVLHTAGAEGEICSILEGYENLRILIHWYSGPEEWLNALIKRGCWFSMGPDLLSNREARKLYSAVPLNRVLIETDEPKSIEWATGKLGRKETLTRLYAKGAALHHLTLKEFLTTVNENADRFLLG